MSIRQRLYPEVEQGAVMVSHCGQRRFVWNLAVDLQNWYTARYARGERGSHGASMPSGVDLMKQLAQARAEFAWLRAGSSVVQQAAIRDFDRARRNHFANPARFGWPTHAKRGQNDGFVIRDLSVRRVNRRWGQVLVPKVGWVRFRLTRPWEQIAACRSARVTFKAGRWHVCFVATAPDFARRSTGTVVGIDRGVANTLATSDGTFDQIPGWREGEKKRLLALEQRKARQVKGSARRRVTVAKIAALHDKVARRRADWIEQTTTHLVRTHDLIGIEALTITNMVKAPKPKPDPDNQGAYLRNGARAKAALNRAIHASCWGRFATRLTVKAASTPEHARCLVIEVPAMFTSQDCRACGHRAPENRESQAVFECVACGRVGHADTNAAGNILDRAMSKTRKTLSTGNTMCEPTTGGDAGGQPVDGRDRGTPTTASTTRVLSTAA